MAGHSGLAEGCFEIPWKGHSGSRQIVGIMLRFVVRGFRCEVGLRKAARGGGFEFWRLVDDHVLRSKKVLEIFGSIFQAMTVKPYDFGSAFGFWFSWAGLGGRSGW